MRAPTLLLGLALLTFLALAPTADSARQPTVFVTEDGAFFAQLSFTTACPGPTTATLAFTGADGSQHVRVVTGWNVGLPSPCDWGCAHCTVPFDWVFVGDDGVTKLAGGGLGGEVDAWSLQGPWQEGHVVSATVDVSVDCGSLCSLG